MANELKFTVHRMTARLPGMTTRPPVPTSKVGGMAIIERWSRKIDQNTVDAEKLLNHVYARQLKQRKKILWDYCRNEICKPELGWTKPPSVKQACAILYQQERERRRAEQWEALRWILESGDFSETLDPEEIELLHLAVFPEACYPSAIPPGYRFSSSTTDWAHTFSQLGSKNPVSRSTVGSRLKRQTPTKPSAWLAEVILKVKKRYEALCKTPRKISSMLTEDIFGFLGGEPCDLDGFEYQPEKDSHDANDEAVTLSYKVSSLKAKTLRGMDGIKAYYFHSEFHLAQIEANAEMPALADRLSRAPVKPLTWSESGRGFIGLGQRGLLSSIERIERRKHKPRSMYEDVAEDFHEKGEEATEEAALDDADDGV